GARGRAPRGPAPGGRPPGGAPPPTATEKSLPPRRGPAVLSLALFRPDPAAGQGASAGEGSSHRRGREAVPRTRTRRRLRVEPRRPLAGLQSIYARGAA